MWTVVTFHCGVGVPARISRRSPELFAPPHPVVSGCTNTPPRSHFESAPNRENVACRSHVGPRRMLDPVERQVQLQSSD